MNSKNKFVIERTFGTITSKQANRKRNKRRGVSGFRAEFGAGSRFYGKGGAG